MGCPTQVELDDNLVFSITTHDPDTGVLTDASSAPVYWIYEEETAVSINASTPNSDSMAKLDDANTTGFYTESIACTTANGYEVGKSYTIYIEATVDGDTGGIAYSFNVTNIRAELAKVPKSDGAVSWNGTALAALNAEVVDALITDTYTEPGTGAPPATASLEEKISWLYAFWRNKSLTTATLLTMRNDADDADVCKATLSDDGTTFTKTEYISG
jgi:hypothetical protein